MWSVSNFSENYAFEWEFGILMVLYRVYEHLVILVGIMDMNGNHILVLGVLYIGGMSS